MAEVNQKMNEKVQAIILAATKNGKRDGRNAEVSIVVTSLNKLRSEFQSLVLDLKNQADDKLFKDKGLFAKLNYEIDELNRTLDEEFITDKMGRLDHENNRHQDDLKRNHEVIMNEIGEEINNIEENKEEAKNELKGIEQEMKQLNLDNHINPKWGMIFIAFLTFLEVPFTHSAFLILRTSPAISIIVAILLSIALALSAHFVGQSVRTGKHKPVAIVFFIISALAIYVASHFRTLHANGQKLDMNNIFLFEDVFFIIIGSLIYITCIAISYYSHNSDEGVRKKLDKLKVSKELAKKKIKNSDKEILEQKNRRNIAIKELQEQQNTLTNNVERKKENIKEDVEKKEKIDQRREVAIKYNSTIDFYKIIEENLNESYKTAILSYKSSYTKERMYHFQVLHNGSNNIDDSIENIFNSIGNLILPLSNEINLPIN